MVSRHSYLWRTAATLWVAGSLFIWIGFLFGHSRDPWLIGYSQSYLFFVALLPVLLAVPPVMVWLARRMGWRRFFAQVGPTLAVLGILYLLAASIYYNRQTHLFDPYLQAPPRRIENLDQARRAGEIRIAALGGSTTAGPTLKPQERYPAQLQQRLAAAGIDATVFNAGQNWWTTKHSLTHYVTHVRHWHPDVVIVMHTINDLYRSCSPSAFAVGEYDDLYSHFYGAAIQGARPPTFLGNLLAQPLRLMDQQWYRPWRRREVDMPVSRFVSIRAYERNLRTLVEIIKGDGSHPVLMTEASLFTVSPKPEEVAVMRFGEEYCLAPAGRFFSEYPSSATMRAAMDAYNAVVRRVAADRGAALVDPDGVMPRDLDHFIDDVHYTPKGAARVAELAFPVVKAQIPTP
jgi:lysophospholipase L1-like esterase